MAAPPTAAHHSDYPVNMKNDDHDDAKYVPWLHIPSEAISLGGELKLNSVLSLKDRKALGLSLRPDDPFAKKLTSNSIKSNDLLLKVTVPKRTGRKRKRGSSDPFLPEADSEHESSHPSNGKQISLSKSSFVEPEVVFRSLRDNASNYTVTPVGRIEEAHRFRNLPDAQYAASRNRMTQSIRKYLMPLNYNTLKNYDLDTAPGVNLDPDVGPPAQFIQSSIPFSYLYRQNPFVKYSIDTDGQGQIVNISKRIALDALHVVKVNADAVPNAPKSHLPPETTLTQYTQDLVTWIRAQLEERPIVTRHLLHNTLGWDKRDKIRDAVPYCGYFFDSGPFKDALIKWGVDPRSDPEFRKYQTISYLSFKRERSRYAEHSGNHVKAMSRLDPDELAKCHYFDGITIPPTANVFQVCDCTDSILRQILDTNDIRETCSPKVYGWYHVGTWVKARVVMRDKVNVIIQGKTPDNAVYRSLVNLPDIIVDDGKNLATAEETKLKNEGKISSREYELLREVRAMQRLPNFLGTNPMSRGRQRPIGDGDIAEDLMDLDAPLPEEVEDLDWEESEGFFDDTDDEDGDDDDEESGDDEISDTYKPEWHAVPGLGATPRT